MCAEFMHVFPLVPIKPVEFFAGNTNAAEHKDFMEAIRDIKAGSQLRADFPLIREIISKVVAPGHVRPADDITNYNLICCAHSPDQAVCESVLALTCPNHGEGGSHMLRAIFHICTMKNDDHYIHYLKFPTMQTHVRPSSHNSILAEKPKRVWKDFLKTMKIAPHNTVESESVCSEKWEQFCKRNAHMGMSFSVIPSYNPERSTAQGRGLDISYFSFGIQHSLELSVCRVDNTFMEIASTHANHLQKFDILVTEHRIPMEDGEHELVITTKNFSRLRCCLLRKGVKNKFIASSDVNFSNNLIYSDVISKGVSNVLGVQRLALRLASSLQANFTPTNIGVRLGLVTKTDKKLLQLIASSDFATDLQYVLKSSSKLCKQLRNNITQLSTPTVLQNPRISEEYFQDSSIFAEKRITSSCRAERPRWQDKHTSSSGSDNMMRQKMMSARGVATLSLFSGFQFNTCVIFSDTDVPKTIYKEPRPATRSLMSAKQLQWGHYLSVADSAVQKKLNQFMYSYDRSAKQLMFFSRKQDSENTIAMFRSTDASKSGTDRTFVEKDVGKGSLVQELIRCCQTHPSLYTRALAHLTLVDSVSRLHHTTHTKKWTDFTSYWINIYRTQYISTIAKRGLTTNAHLDEQYIDYCTFIQCLKQHVDGLRMPSDLYAMLVQQGIPFPFA
jgi:hypothetical protein